MKYDLRKMIENADVYDLAFETPLTFATDISRKNNCFVFMKREDLQPGFSFKLRGAYNKIKSLSEDELKNGVVAASAGNHAQGVAMAALGRKIKAYVVMPCSTAELKINSVLNLGAKVILKGETFEEAYTYAKLFSKETDRFFIHPYDDPYVIAGQGTIGSEIDKQIGVRLDAVFIPVGGGGLIAGIAFILKKLRPDVKIIGVESEESACLYKSFKTGKRIKLRKTGSFAQGISVSQLGKHPYEILKDCIDDAIKVSNEEIRDAVKDIFYETRVIVEPAGAAGYAGIKKYISGTNVRNNVFVTINSGANINLTHIGEIFNI